MQRVRRWSVKVLVVEDHPTSRRLLETCVRAIGHEVLVATNGAEAWSIFQSTPVQVVVSDWMMPEMDGLELCRRIRRHPREAYTYLILLTAYDGKNNHLGGMEAGADNYLVKPLDADLLAARLKVAERILGLQALARQLEDLLPFCASGCKRILDEDEGWVSIERHVAKRTSARLSHGVCPDCRATVVQDAIERALGRRP